MARPNYSQAETIALARKIYQFVSADIVDFAAFDASIDAAYLSNFNAAIADTENHPDDETVVDIQTGYTAALADAEKKCRKAYQRLKIFVEKAFPNNRSVQNEFGFNDYADASTIAEFIKFMNKIAGAATKYSTDLMGVSYPAADITNLADLHKQLVIAVSNQENYKSERMRLTDERERLLTKLYDYISFLAKIGKMIYEDNRAQYARYLLPTTSSSNSNVSRIDGQAWEVIVPRVFEPDYYTLRVLSSGMPLQFYVAPNGSTAVPATTVTLQPSLTATDLSAEELGYNIAYSGQQSLFVYNPNTQEVGYTFQILS